MQKSLKVLITEDGTSLTKECEKVLKSYGMEVVLTKKRRQSATWRYKRAKAGCCTGGRVYA